MHSFWANTIGRKVETLFGTKIQPANLVGKPFKKRTYSGPRMQEDILPRVAAPPATSATIRR